MATTNIPLAEPGLAAFQQGNDFAVGDLFNASIPLPVTEDFPVGQSTILPARSVVGLDGSGNLVLARNSGTVIAPIGITTVEVATGAGQTDRIAIWRAGNFNPAALNWHADYDTDDEKFTAFRGSPSPTNIVIRKRL